MSCLMRFLCRQCNTNYFLLYVILLAQIINISFSSYVITHFFTMKWLKLFEIIWDVDIFLRI